MTLENAKTSLPAPEGGYWFQSDDRCFVCRTDGSGKLLFKIIVKDLLDDVWSIRVDNYLDDLSFQCRPTTETLVQMYRRALGVTDLLWATPEWPEGVEAEMLDATFTVTTKMTRQKVWVEVETEDERTTIGARSLREAFGGVIRECQRFLKPVA